MKFILASGSPRRIELLKNLNLDFKIIKSDIEEKVDIEKTNPFDVVKELSKLKALDVGNKIKAENNEETIIIAADTIVNKDNKILEKPIDKDDAVNMIKTLSGTYHNVVTGITLYNVNTGAILSDYEVTKVYFKNLLDSEIEAYIKKGEYVDKAGAYGIQQFGALLVEKIEGCYFNVVGLPINKLNSMLGEFGVNLFYM